MIDYYRLLLLTPNASSDQIRKAFRKEAKKYHPDLHQGKDPQEKRRLQKHFILITQAYETLIDPDKRREYDRQFAKNKEKQQKPHASASSSSSRSRTQQTASSTTYSSPEEPLDTGLDDLLKDVDDLLGKFDLKFKDPLEVLLEWAMKIFRELTEAFQEDTQSSSKSQGSQAHQERTSQRSSSRRESASFSSKGDSILEEIEEELQRMKHQKKTGGLHNKQKKSGEKTIDQELREIKRRYGKKR